MNIIFWGQKNIALFPTESMGTYYVPAIKKSDSLCGKPLKYGLKIVLLNDVSTKYLINASPYLGKSTQANGLPLADHFMEFLARPIYGTNRNITMDNWFTNVPFAGRLLSNPYKLTIVGPFRKK